MQYPIDKIVKDFPILSREVNGKPLVYLDNAATTQTPTQVVKAMEQVYTSYKSNIHRGVHTLSNLCTAAYEESRQKVKSFINASSEREVIFTKGTTEAINLVAASFGDTFLAKGDEVIISGLEHHSNIVPWQLLRARKGVALKVIPVLDDGTLDMEAFQDLLGPRTKLVAVAHISNVLGTVNPVEEIIDAAHRHQVPVLIDGAQAIQHQKVDVAAMDCDFYAFSGHKLYGPTGIGVLYGKEKWLDAMTPWQGGGEMIKSVSFEKTTFNELPYKFEAGTPDFIGAIGLGAAIDYISNIGLDVIANHEKDLLNHAIARLTEIGNITFYGTAPSRASLVSFIPRGLHPFDVGTLLDKMGIAVRTGHHCAQPLMERFAIPGTIRASFAMYNTTGQVDTLVEGVVKARQLLRN